MQEIVIFCDGYKEVKDCFKMLKEIFKILNVYCLIQEGKREIIVNENTRYTIINKANPCFKKLIAKKQYKKYLNKDEIENRYNILKLQIEKILS